MSLGEYGVPDRGIDHLVLCAHDLDELRAFYERIGFTLTPEARHPFGTANSLAQLDGFFLELLTVADPDLITEPSENRFSFGAYNRDYLKDGEGCSMLAFEGADARADSAEFASAGLDTYEPFDFERKAGLPDGTDVRVAFSLTFVTHRDMPRITYFTCQQHAPEYFWKPEYQTHPNTAREILTVTIVAPDPLSYRRLFEGLQGSEAVAEEGDSLKAATARGSVVVLSEGGWRESHGGLPAPDPDAGPQIAAYAIGVADLDKTREIVREAGVTAMDGDGRIVISPRDAFGVAIEFRAAAG